MRKLHIACAATVLAFGLACGNLSSEDDPTGGSGGTRAPELPTASVSPSTVDDGSRGAGTYDVGTGIAPGKWQTKGVTGGIGCYWARKKDATGEFGSIHANGYVEPGATGLMEIKATDKVVQFTGDCKWTKVA
jgi:hypothetical protein